MASSSWAELSPDERDNARADACPWQSGPCGCDPQGPPRVCTRPDRRGREVWRPDCISCVRADQAKILLMVPREAAPIVRRPMPTNASAGGAGTADGASS